MLSETGITVVLRMMSGVVTVWSGMVSRYGDTVWSNTYGVTVWSGTHVFRYCSDAGTHTSVRSPEHGSIGGSSGVHKPNFASHVSRGDSPASWPVMPSVHAAQ